MVFIGAEKYDSPGWCLEFAEDDALELSRVLCPLVEAAGYNVTVQNIMSTGPHGADMKAALAVTMQRIAKSAWPDDLVFLFFSGHGFADQRGDFYLLTRDAPKDLIPGQRLTQSALDRCISQTDLANYFRGIDAGVFAIIIDACYSAGAIEQPGFKPAPIGNRGFGQLAYDKQMLVLTAAQNNELAIEDGDRRHGLLTYALVHDGLEARMADGQPADGVITLAELCAFAARRVPDLCTVLAAPTDARAEKGRLYRVSKDARFLGVPKGLFDAQRQQVQTPALFDYTRGRHQLVLHRTP